jgi:hypothetical protein
VRRHRHASSRTNDWVNCARFLLHNQWAWKAVRRFDYSNQGDVRFHDVTFRYDEQVTCSKTSIFASRRRSRLSAPRRRQTTIRTDQRSTSAEGLYHLDGRRQQLKKTTTRSLFMCCRTALFTGTVAQHRYGRQDATDEEIVEAAKSPSAFVHQACAGYEGVTRTAKPFAGQRQCRDCARGGCQPTVLIWMKPSSIDTRTEALIERDGSLMAGTVFVMRTGLDRSQQQRHSRSGAREVIEPRPEDLLANKASIIVYMACSSSPDDASPKKPEGGCLRFGYDACLFRVLRLVEVNAEEGMRTALGRAERARLAWASLRQTWHLDDRQR